MEQVIFAPLVQLFQIQNLQKEIIVLLEVIALEEIQEQYFVQQEPINLQKEKILVMNALQEQYAQEQVQLIQLLVQLEHIAHLAQQQQSAVLQALLILMKD